MKAFLRKILIFPTLGLCSLFAELRLEFFTGSDILAFAAELASISNILYKEYPYLYGIEDEAEFYITRYCHSNEAKLCLAYDGARIVGYTIGVPLKNYSLSFHEPFIRNKLDVGRFFYIGEIALFPEYRGQAIGKDMLLQMERLVRQELSYPEICLAHIDESRVLVIPPVNHVSLAHVWTKLGYELKENLFFSVDWPNVGDVDPSTHTLVYWVKRLR